jgi:septal ring factor EnvC (AmiA/AmiB activator)
MKIMKSPRKVTLDKITLTSSILFMRYSKIVNLEKMMLQLKMNDGIRVLEEADYMENIIDERQKDIDKISKIMGDVREIAKDFNQEVNSQGYKIEELEQNNEATAANAAEATKQLKDANRRSKKNG